MKLPSFKRIYESDYTEEDRELVRQLAVSLNTGIENIYLALSSRLTFADNFQCTVRNINVTVDSNGIPQDTTAFQLNAVGGTQAISRVIGIQVLAVTNLDDESVYPTGTPFISFNQDERVINIEHIAGLPAGFTFQLTLVAFN